MIGFDATHVSGFWGKKDNMASIEVSTITIKLGTREIELKPDEAMDLQNKLNDLFGKFIVNPYPYTWYYVHPPWHPGTPIYTQPDVICTGDGTYVTTRASG